MLGKSISAGSLWASCLWFVIGALTLPAGAQYGGGIGTADSPYLIFTARQLDAIGSNPDHWDRHFRLMADIDLGEYGPAGFHTIGTPEQGSFTGIFDGNRKTISNFRQLWEFGGYLGLFGVVEGPQARIENVTLVDPHVASETGRYLGALVGSLEEATVANCHVRGGSVQGMSFVGGLVGTSDGGTISGCTASASVGGMSRIGGLLGQGYYGVIEGCRTAGEVLGPPSSYWIGGLIGENREATVRDCRAGGTVQGDLYVGGLIGESLRGTVERCCAAGSVKGGTTVGGLLGQNSGGTVSDCYATADTKATIYVGGLVGNNESDCHCVVYIAGVVTHCYATGAVWGVNSGGLIGLNYRSETRSSFWDVQTTGRSESAGGDGRTTLEMGRSAMYLSAGWDFVDEKKNGTKDIWWLPAGQKYPTLAWELSAGDFNADGWVNFRDYSMLANQWRKLDSKNWSGGSFVAADGTVDFDDLMGLATLWLTSGK